MLTQFEFADITCEKSGSEWIVRGELKNISSGAVATTIRVEGERSNSASSDIAANADADHIIRDEAPNFVQKSAGESG